MQRAFRELKLAIIVDCQKAFKILSAAGNNKKAAQKAIGDAGEIVEKAADTIADNYGLPDINERELQVGG